MKEKYEENASLKKGMSSRFTKEPNTKWKDARRRHKFYSSCNRYTYHVSIIDYLTDFNLNKQIESKFKTLRKLI